MALSPVPGDDGTLAAPPIQPIQPMPAQAQPGTVTQQDIRARVLAALQNLLTLRVTTVVGPVRLRGVDDFNARTEIVFPDDQVVESASTAINLVAGDITQVRTTRFAEDPAYAKLHDDSLAAARAIISSNVATLKEALTGLERLLWKG